MSKVENLRSLKTLAESYEGEKRKGVTKMYILRLLVKYEVEPVLVDGQKYYDLTKLPKEIKSKLKF